MLVFKDKYGIREQSKFAYQPAFGMSVSPSNNHLPQCTIYMILYWDDDFTNKSALQPHHLLQPRIQF